MTENDLDKTNILTLRARRLAERPTASVTTNAAGPVVARESILIFQLGAERFAVRLKFVAGVVPFERVTPVPTAAANVLGVMAIRGDVHTVYAFERLLDLPRTSPDQSGDGQVLALRGVGRQIAVRVDRVEAIDYVAPVKDAAVTARRFVTPVDSAPLILIEDLETLFTSLSRGDDQ